MIDAGIFSNVCKRSTE